MPFEFWGWITGSWGTRFFEKKFKFFFKKVEASLDSFSQLRVSSSQKPPKTWEASKVTFQKEKICAKRPKSPNDRLA